MQPISSSLHQFSSAADRQLMASAFRSSDLTRLNASTETHTDLSVITAGGDRVTLSAEALLRASYADLNSQTLDQRYRLDLHATGLEIQTHKSAAVSIQGELDQEEQADLQRLIGKLEVAVKQFLSGDSEGALSTALNLGDLGTVAAFELNVQQVQQVALTQEHHASATGPASQLKRQGADDQAKVSSLVNQIVDSINDTKIDINKLLKRLPNLLGHLFEKLGANVSDQDLAQLSSDVETALKTNPVAPDSASS
jgi:hypothetical protein